MIAPRIIGTELEYGAELYDERGFIYTPEYSMSDSWWRENIPSEYDGLGQFIANGARLYMDIGNHPEYATQESITVNDVVANECAGDRVVYQTLQNLAYGQSPHHGFALNRRVSDHKGNAWGYHENYSYPVKGLDVDSRNVRLQNIALHIATRNLYVGAGAMLSSGRFAIAQKGSVISDGLHQGTTSTTKPLIALREEHHADSGRWNRANVVGGDPNMSPWATRLKLGTTALVMDALEHNFKVDYLMPANLAITAKQVAADLTMRHTVELADGKTIRPLDIQIGLLTNVQKMSRNVDLGVEKMGIIDEWARALEDLETGSDALLDRADWPKRLQILQAYADKHDLPMDAPELYGVDRLWDSLHPNGIGVRLREGLWKRWMPTEELITERLTHAPWDTRAAVRSRFVHFAKDRHDRQSFQAEWSFLLNGLGDSQWLRIELNDPFASYNAQLERLMASQPRKT